MRRHNALLVLLAGLAGLSLVISAAFLLGSRHGDVEPTPVHDDRTAPPALGASPRPRAQRLRPVEGPSGAPAPVFASALEIQVLREDRPLAGVELRVYREAPLDPNTGKERWTHVASAPTGGEGAARVEAVPGRYFVAARERGRVVARGGVVKPSGEAVTRYLLRTSPAHGLTGRVVERGSGRPAPLAEVELAWVDEASPFGQFVSTPEEERVVTTADGRGLFRVDGLSAGQYLAQARAVGTGRSSRKSFRVPASAPLVLELGGAGTLEGFVLDASGQPVGGAEIQAAGAGEGEPTLAQTGPGGGFALEVDPGPHWLTARRGGLAGALTAPVSVAPGETRRVGVIRLAEAASLEGTVRTKEDGAPVAGAEISVSPYGLNGDTARAQSGPDGRFVVDALPPGAHDVVVRAAGHTELLRRGVVVASGQRFRLELLLESTGALEGIVVDASGVPAAFARVRVSPASFARPVEGTEPEAVTRVDGRFALEGLRPGRVRLHAIAAGGGESGGVEAYVRAGGRTDVEVRLKTGAVVRGRVADERGVPVAGAFVTSFPMASVGLGGSDRARAETDGDGRFTLALSPGSHQVSAAREGETPPEAATRLVSLQPGGNEELALVLPSAPQEPLVTGSVVDPAGAPAPYAQVTLEAPGASHGYAFTRADEAGRFQLLRRKHLDALQVFQLLASHPVTGWTGRATGVRAGARDVRITLEDSGSVEGQVSPGVQGAYTVRVLPDRPGGPGGASELEFQAPRFLVTGVQPGPSVVQVVTDDGRVGRTAVDVRSGERAQVTVALSSSAGLRVRFVDAKTKAPIPDVLTMLFPGALSERSDAEGRVDFKGLSAGEVQLQAFRIPYGGVSRRYSVAAGERLDVGDVELTPR